MPLQKLTTTNWGGHAPSEVDSSQVCVDWPSKKLSLRSCGWSMDMPLLKLSITKWVDMPLQKLTTTKWGGHAPSDGEMVGVQLA